MTGAVKWHTDPIGVGVHFRHLAMRGRAAAPGRAWAHAGLEPDAPLLYVAEGGFEEGFEERLVDMAGRNGRPVVAHGLDDPFAV